MNVGQMAHILALYIIDYLIHALLEIETDYFFNYHQWRLLSGFNPKAMREERHKQGMNISAALIKVHV